MNGVATLFRDWHRNSCVHARTLQLRAWPYSAVKISPKGGVTLLPLVGATLLKCHIEEMALTDKYKYECVRVTALCDYIAVRDDEICLNADEEVIC